MHSKTAERAPWPPWSRSQLRRRWLHDFISMKRERKKINNKNKLPLKQSRTYLERNILNKKRYAATFIISFNEGAAVLHVHKQEVKTKHGLTWCAVHKTIYNSLSRRTVNHLR